MPAKIRKKTTRKNLKPRHRRKCTRVTVDFPENEHRKLKALASLEGVTMQEFIRSHVMEKVERMEIPDAKFKKLMNKILDENEDALKRLADK